MEQQDKQWVFYFAACMVAVCLLFSSCKESEDLPQFTSSNTGPYLLNIEHLELIDSLKAVDPVLNQAFQQLIRGADSLLTVSYTYVPEKNILPPSGDPHDYMSLHRYSYYNPKTGKYDIIKDGQTNPEIYDYDKPKLEKMSFSVYILALAYYYTGNESYARKASDEITNWFLNPETYMNPNMNYASIRPGVSEKNGSGIVGALDFIDIIEATGLLYGSDHWTPDLHYKLKEWFYDFYQWMRNHYPTDSYSSTNISTWMDVQRAIYLLFTGQEEKLNSMSHIQPVSERLEEQIKKDGLQAYETSRGAPQRYVYFNLKAYTLLSLIRKNQYNRVGYDRDWHVLKNCALSSCESGGLKAALDDIGVLLHGTKKSALFSTESDFDTCRYLEIFRPAAVAFDSAEYGQVAQHLVNEGCRNSSIVLAFPPQNEL